MNRRVALAALVSIAMLGAYVHAQFGNTPAKLDTIKIKDDLFVIHNDFVPGTDKRSVALHRQRPKPVVTSTPFRRLR